MLDEILKAREERWHTRCHLATGLKATVISVTMNIPGPNKTRELYIKAHKIFVDFLMEAIAEKGYSLIHHENRVTPDGPEAYLVLEARPMTIKALTIDLEDSHPLGRLMDVDIMDKDQEIYSRSNLDKPERQCMICTRPARLCIIERTHPLKEILSKIDGAIEPYLEKGKD